MCKHAHRALFHSLHDDLLQSSGLLLVSGDPCQPDNVKLGLPKAVGVRGKSQCCGGSEGFR